MHRFRVLIAVIAVAFIGLSVFWGWRIAAANERDAANAVASCERGNEIRDYLAFDNTLRIKRIETGLLDPATPDKAELRVELADRYRKRERLIPYNCETLR